MMMVYVVMCVYEDAFDFSVAGNLKAAIKTANHYVEELLQDGFKPDEDWDSDPFLAEDKTFKVFEGRKGIVRVYFREKEVLND